MNRKFDPSERVLEAIDKYSDMIRRICGLYIKNPADIEDVFQDVFLKLFLHRDPFENEQHQKAWLCRVAFNKCKDLCRSVWHRKVQSIEDCEIPFEDREQEELVKAVLQLPPDYRQVIYLHFYEDRTIPEIAGILGRNLNTTYTILRRAKERLKQKAGDLILWTD